MEQWAVLLSLLKNKQYGQVAPFYAFGLPDHPPLIGVEAMLPPEKTIVPDTGIWQLVE